MATGYSILPFDRAREFYTDERCFINELSNSEADPDCSLALARVEPGVTTQMHRVLDTVERYIIISGQGEVDIDGNGPKPVAAFDVVLIPPAVPQRITNTGTEDLVFLCVCSPRFLAENYRHLSDD